MKYLVCGSGEKILIDAADAREAMVLSGLLGDADVYECQKAGLFTALVEVIQHPQGTRTQPFPRATAPDRPSNVGQPRPTVELPDLGDLKF